MRTLSLLTVLILFSCSNAAPPRGVPDPEKMKSLIWDLARTDELVNYRKMRDSSYNSIEKTVTVYDTVLSIHGLTKEQFQQTLAYYNQHPELLQPIFDSLQKRSEERAVPFINEQ